MARTDSRTRSSGFGTIQKLPSGKYRARYTDPQGTPSPSGGQLRHAAPHLFETKQDAQAWLSDEFRLISAGAWTSPKARQAAALRATDKATFGAYAKSWLAGRKNSKGQPLAARTRDHYQYLLDDYLLPRWDNVPLKEIDAGDVNLWYDLLAPGKPTTKAHAYSLFRSIMITATGAHGPLVGRVNPAAVRGGGAATRKSKTVTASSDEVVTILEHMPEDRKLMVLLALWTALRYGEIAELRRSDVDLKRNVLQVRRAVTRSKSEGVYAKAPKSEAGIRDIPIPAHILPSVTEHLEKYCRTKDALLFPAGHGGHLAPSTFYGYETEYRKDGTVKREGVGWHAARQAAGRQDLRFHDLRHTGAVLAAQSGATLAELMERLGQSTAAAAMRYQSVASKRQAEISDRLSEMAAGGEW